MSVPQEPSGLLIVGHGTRDPAGIAEFHQTVELISRRLANVVVEGGFLELAEPTIAAALDRAVQRGAQRLAAAPLVLFAAGHAKQDIPAALAAAANTHELPVPRLLPHLGCHPAMIRLSLKRYEEAIERLPTAADSETLLLMVGRGSTDAEANSELARFARLRWEARPVGWHETCFAALAQPSLERAMAMAARLPFRRVVVQPHLLFQGELLRGIRHTVETHARRWPAIEWAVTEHLGPDELLAEAVAEGSGFGVQGSAYA
ncbi:MAG TPA: sirohydrochlorin chelatase [Pirellulales bacterium]|nr:sirohydrochlorin chelatase [Pirellulales bacterium]